MTRKLAHLSHSLLLVAAMLFSQITAFAQNTITGTVTDAKTGSPLSGVNVSIKGTKSAVQTFADGRFTINAGKNSGTLIFSYVGYGIEEKSFSGSVTVSVALIPSDKKMEDVVVVAYGTRKKTDLTGSVTQVTAKEFQKGNITSSEQLLVGKVAGLEVTTGGGSAGGGSKLRIRGGASLNASNDPLIVIDGVPAESNGISGSANLLNTINPDDIESVSVLKDAAATAQYGSRASNGVIIITTKKGSKGKTKFNFNTQFSVSTVAKYVDVLSGDEIRKIVTADALATGNNTWASKLGTANTDWQKEIYQAGVGNISNVSASGNWNLCKTSMPFRASFGFAHQDGVLKTDKFNRYSTALNLAPKFWNDHLSVNFNFKYSNTHCKTPLNQGNLQHKY